MHIVRIRPAWLKIWPPPCGTKISACHVGSPLCNGTPSTTKATFTSWRPGAEAGAFRAFGERLGDLERVRDLDETLGDEALEDLDLDRFRELRDLDLRDRERFDGDLFAELDSERLRLEDEDAGRFAFARSRDDRLLSDETDFETDGAFDADPVDWRALQERLLSESLALPFLPLSFLPLALLCVFSFLPLSLPRVFSCFALRLSSFFALLRLSFSSLFSRSSSCSFAFAFASFSAFFANSTATEALLRVLCASSKRASASEAATFATFALSSASFAAASATRYRTSAASHSIFDASRDFCARCALSTAATVSAFAASRPHITARTLLCASSCRLTASCTAAFPEPLKPPVRLEALAPLPSLSVPSSVASARLGGTSEPLLALAPWLPAFRLDASDAWQPVEADRADRADPESEAEDDMRAPSHENEKTGRPKG